MHQVSPGELIPWFFFAFSRTTLLQVPPPPPFFPGGSCLPYLPGTCFPATEKKLTPGHLFNS
jgi:hypothetical protein